MYKPGDDKLEVRELLVKAFASAWEVGDKTVDRDTYINSSINVIDSLQVGPEMIYGEEGQGLLDAELDHLPDLLRADGAWVYYAVPAENYFILTWMEDAEKAAALQSTFTADSIKGLNLMLNAGAGELSSFRDDLYGCAGAAEDAAAAMTDNLQGDLAGMGSAFEELALKIYDGVQEPLRSAVQFVAGSVVPALTFLVEHVDYVAVALGGVAAAVAAGLAWQPESAEAAGSGALGVYAGEYDQSERNQEDASGEQPTGADLLALYGR